MAAAESLVFNGLALNTFPASAFNLEALDMTPPAKNAEWAKSVDSDGANLVRTPLFENRTVSFTLRVAPQASKDLALKKLGEVIDRIQEAEKNPGGIPLEWTPSEGTKTITFYVLTGSINKLPISQLGEDAGWMVHTPKIEVSLICKPFGYGEETTGSAKSIETGLSVVTLEASGVPGDVPAEGRLIIKDTASVPRRWVEWGLENRYYNAALGLILDNEGLTPVGGAQSTVLNAAGAYKPGGATKGTLATVLVTEPTICANTGNLLHVGTYRVKARVYAASGSGISENMHVRLAWQDGSGPMRSNEWVSAPVPGLFSEVDLGTVIVNPAESGSQKWLGQIEAYSTNAPGADTLHIDYLTFIPLLEGYGRARGVMSTAPGTVVAYDAFNTGVLSGSLNGRTPPVGAAWATSGATTDWAVSESSEHVVSRKTISDATPRWGQVGPSIANCRVAATLSSGVVKNGVTFVGVIARWVNSSNYAFCLGEVNGNSSIRAVKLGVVVAGVTTFMNTAVLSNGQYLNHLYMSLTATADGALSAEGHDITGASFSLHGTNAALKTGEALATGKCGIYDLSSTSETVTRSVIGEGAAGKLAVIVWELPGPPYCVQSTRSMEARWDSTLTADSSGTYYGPSPSYRGSRFFVPQAGSANRTSRVLVKADRNDLQEADQNTIGDAFTAQIAIRPRYSVIPR